MDNDTCIATLAALAQPIRLETFRLLVKHEPNGLPAGQVGRHVGVPQSTLSMNFAVLLRAGLVTSKRAGRTFIYRANMVRLRALILFLVQNCCGSSAELRESLLTELLPAVRHGRGDRGRRPATSHGPNRDNSTAIKRRTSRA